MDQEDWAIVTLRVAGEALDVDRLAADLGRPNTSLASGVWAADLGQSPDPLEAQLDAATAFLRSRLDTLRNAAQGAEINLNIGWTPRRPQDGLRLSTELIDLLAAIRGYVLLDTYE